MKQFEARFKQVDVLPMVKHYMNELDLFNLFLKYFITVLFSLLLGSKYVMVIPFEIISYEINNYFTFLC